MFMYDELGKNINGNVLCGVNILYISMDEEYKTVMIFLHNLSEGTFITIKETAVATCTVIHKFLSLF